MNDCPCENFFILTEDDAANAELDQWLSNDPDGDWDIFDMHYFADRDMCEECPYMEEFNRESVEMQ